MVGSARYMLAFYVIYRKPKTENGIRAAVGGSVALTLATAVQEF